MRSLPPQRVAFASRIPISAACIAATCLACATPFPFDRLEEGMAAHAALQEFGEPESIEAGSGDAGSCWCYLHEEQEWVVTLFPLTLFLTPLLLVAGNSWDDAYLIKKPVVLHFEQGELVRWDVRQPSGYWRVPPHYRRNPHSAADHLDDPLWSPEKHRRAPPDSPVDPLHLVFESGDYVAGNDPSCRPAKLSAEPLFRPGESYHVSRSVSLWLDPVASSARRDSLERGERVRLLGKRCQWCHVEDESGSEGWVACVFLDPGGPSRVRLHHRPLCSRVKLDFLRLTSGCLRHRTLPPSAQPPPGWTRSCDARFGKLVSGN